MAEPLPNRTIMGPDFSGVATAIISRIISAPTVPLVPPLTAMETSTTMKATTETTATAETATSTPAGNFDQVGITCFNVGRFRFNNRVSRHGSRSGSSSQSGQTDSGGGKGSDCKFVHSFSPRYESVTVRGTIPQSLYWLYRGPSLPAVLWRTRCNRAMKNP